MKTQMTNEVILRMAGPGDRAALRHLAALDSADVPAEPQLVAEVDGELVAALSLVDGCRIADPFRPTAAVVEILAMRGAQLTGDGRAHGHALSTKECPKATPSIEPLAV